MVTLKGDHLFQSSAHHSHTQTLGILGRAWIAAAGLECESTSNGRNPARAESNIVPQILRSKKGQNIILFVVSPR